MTPSSPPSTPHASTARRGRPRDPERSRAIREAARSLLNEGGWDALTIEAVASRAGVGRPTVYRRWPTKGYLAAEVLGMEVATGATTNGPTRALPSTGSLRGDLLALLDTLTERLDALERSGVLPGVVAEMALDSELAHRIRSEVLAPDRQHLAEVVRQGVERGEARDELDPGMVIDLLWSQVLVLRYVVHEPPDDATLERLVDLVVSGVG